MRTRTQKELRRHAHRGPVSQGATGPVPEPIPAAPKEAVKHPDHYNWLPCGVEARIVARDMSFNIGSAMTYLWRSGHKGTQIQDLKKAIFHIVDEIDRVEQQTGVKPQERYVFAKHGGRLP
jgi:hypothetical protein